MIKYTSLKDNNAIVLALALVLALAPLGIFNQLGFSRLTISTYLPIVKLDQIIEIQS